LPSWQKAPLLDEILEPRARLRHLSAIERVGVDTEPAGGSVRRAAPAGRHRRSCPRSTTGTRTCPGSQLRRNEIEDHVVERAGTARRSAKNELEFLKAVLRRAEERGQRVDGRLLRIEPVRHEPREGISLTPTELAELASWFPEDTKRLVLLAGTVGARQNEWFTLDQRQLELDGDEPVMRIPRTLNKSRRPKTIPLTSREALLLKEQLLARTAGTSLVFPSRKGEQWNRHRFRDQVWQDAIEAAGYDSLGFHQPRHTAISLMCAAGYRLEWVAERVGHADGGALILKCCRHLSFHHGLRGSPCLVSLRE
jgi:integrase